MTESLGIRVTVQRDEYASTTGPSATCDELTVVGWVDESRRTGKIGQLTAEQVQPMPTDLQQVAATDDAPAVWLFARRLSLGRGTDHADAGEPFYVLEPASAIGDPRPWFMFGGNFAAGDAAWEAPHHRHRPRPGQGLGPGRVMTETEADRVARLAGEFWQRVGPRINQDVQRRSRHDVDEGDVEAAMVRGLRNQPLPDTLTRAEQHIVAGRLLRAGRSARQVAELMGVKKSLIEAWRARGQCPPSVTNRDSQFVTDRRRSPRPRAALTGNGMIASVGDNIQSTERCPA